jgi:hypothetical protein
MMSCIGIHSHTLIGFPLAVVCFSLNSDELIGYADTDSPSTRQISFFSFT